MSQKITKKPTLAERFERIEEQDDTSTAVPPEYLLSKRPDLCAFMLLEKLLPGKRGEEMICHSEHDEITLSIDIKKLAKVINDDQIKVLIQCGVHFDSYEDALRMFV